MTNNVLKNLKKNREPFIYLFFILLLHAFFLNRLEKLSFGKLLSQNIKYRPSNLCKGSKKLKNFYCLGMPSGHAELITILSVFLVIKKIIPIEIAIILIIIVCLQRIIFKMHTPLQILIGIIFGLCFSWIYFITGYSWKSLLFTISVILLLILLIFY